MTCTHTHTRDLADYPFTGPVGPAEDQNPAAHGGVTVEVECLACGARRQENWNGCHGELGTWGDSRAEREAALRAAERAQTYAAKVAYYDALRARPAAITLRRGQQSASVYIDDEGYIVSHEVDLSAECVAAAAPEFFCAARELRLAALALAEVES